MKTILILAVSALCVFSAKADDDYATIVRYLGENGHYIISPDDVAKVRAFMKANGYQHVSEIPKGAFAAGDAVAQPAAAEAAPGHKKQKVSALDQITSIERSFDLDKRPGEIAEVLKNAGYDLTMEELNIIRSFIEDYGWYSVINTFRATELALVRFRALSTGSP